jgi:SAM-dependent methyltransferase
VTGAPPDAYERHVGRYGAELAAGMVGVARLSRGNRALDVGCGPGALTLALAALLGPERTAAVDPSDAFVERCRSRAPGADVRVGMAEDLPFGDGEFDAVLAQLVVDGMDDARRGVAEMKRVGRPGAVVAACVWDFDGGMPLLNTLWATALAHDAELARSFGAGKRLPFSRPEELSELWRVTGLDGAELTELVAGANYDSFEDLWSPFTAGVGKLGSFLAALDDDGRETVKQDAARRFGSPEGPFRLWARALCVRGAVPGG